MAFTNHIIQKIYRNYSENESIQFLKAELKEMAFEKGVLISEFNEAKHEIQLLKTQLYALEKELIALQNAPKPKVITPDEMVVKLNTTIARLSKKVAELTKEKKLYQNKYLGLLPYIEKLKSKSSTGSFG